MALELESQSEPELQPAKRRRRLRPLFKDGEEFEAPWAANQVALVATPSKEASAGREEAVAGSALEQPALLTDNRVSAAAAAAAAPKAAVKGAARAEAADKAAARAEAKTAAKAVAQAEAAAKAAARAAAKAAAKAAAQAEAAAKAAARAEAKAKVKSKTQAKAKQVRKSGRAKLGTDATNPASGLSGAAVAEDNVAAEAAETPEVQGNEEKAADLAPEASVARTNASEEVNVAQDSPTLETIRAASDEKEDTGDHERFNRESESCAGGAALAQLYSDCASEGKPSETMGVAMEEDATVSINSALKAAEPLHTQAKNSASIEPDANESSFGGSMHIAGTIGQLSAHIAETNQAGSGGPQTSETHLVTLSKAVHTAKERVLQLSQTQGTSCMRLQNALQGEFDLATRSNDCAGEFKQEIESVFAAGARAEVAALTSALDLANAQGLPMEGTMAGSLLEKLRKEEELEGIWCCLASSLEAADRVAIVFWCEEAAQLGVTVPPEIDLALDDLKSEEAARLARWESEASLAALATTAFHRRDIEALRDLAEQAQRAGSDPSAALAALAALTGDLQEDDTESAGITGTPGASCSSFSFPAQSSNGAEPEEEELERLYVSSPNGQAHCFGMYVLVREEKPNGMPVWRQLGGERWLYADKDGRWSIGSNKVREKNFNCSAGFIFCPEPHGGIMPHEMKMWCRWDEGKNKWAKDDEITVASEYVEEVIEPRRKRGAGRSAKQGKSRGGRAGRGRGEGQPKASGRQTRQAAQHQQQPPGSALPHRTAASGTRFPHSQQPPPSFLPSAAGMGKAKALRVLGFSAAQSVNAEDLRKAYRQQALRWHPDRPQNHGSEQEAKSKFLKVREAFEFMQACLEPMRFLQGGSSGGL